MTAAVSSSIVTSIDNEEPALWAQGEKGEISGHFTQCCCEFKPALKKKKKNPIKKQIMCKTSPFPWVSPRKNFIHISKYILTTLRGLPKPGMAIKKNTSIYICSPTYRTLSHTLFHLLHPDPIKSHSSPCGSSVGESHL
jgi:hypothetical protein